MARTMTVDVGDELHEKQAESRLQELRDLLAEGISSGEAKPWNKNAFLRNVRARWQMKEIELTPKAEEDLEAIWDYSFRQIGLFRRMHRSVV
jgi:antitoxin ParD1/3/4